MNFTKSSNNSSFFPGREIKSISCLRLQKNALNLVD